MPATWQMSRRPLVGTAAVLATLTLTACGAPERPADHESDLGRYRSVLWAIDVEEARPRWTEYQEHLATCMAEAGFDYWPESDVPDAFFGRMIPPEIGTLEYAKEFGYGVTTETEGPGSVPQMWAPVVETPAMQQNRDYRGALSEQARQEYDVAMSGELAEIDRYDAESIDWSTVDMGCSTVAEEATDGFRNPDEFTAVSDAMGRLWLRIAEDSEVAIAARDWAQCMAGAGHPGLADPAAAEDSVSTMLWDEWQDTYASHTSGTSGVTDYDVVRTEIPQALAELREAEIALAVADATCREETGYNDVHRAVTARLEQEFLDTYRADLDAWLAWFQESRQTAG